MEIVNDTPKNILMLGKTFHDIGYNLSIAISGSQTLNAAKKEKDTLKQGGRIWVTSKLGIGKAFTFTLPFGIVNEF